MSTSIFVVFNWFYIYFIYYNWNLISKLILFFNKLTWTIHKLNLWYVIIQHFAGISIWFILHFSIRFPQRWLCFTNFEMRRVQTLELLCENNEVTTSVTRLYHSCCSKLKSNRMEHWSFLPAMTQMVEKPLISFTSTLQDASKGNEWALAICYPHNTRSVLLMAVTTSYIDS